MTLTILALIAVLMLLETFHSRRNERALRARGAREPHDDVYRWMQIVYPGSFILMGVEGLSRGEPPEGRLVAGAILFGAAKALKYWAISSLGPFWSFRVLVLPGASLVTTGPYRWFRHPNYLGVMGELLGAAVLLHAPIAGIVGVVAFGFLLRRRIAVEERALRDA
jgi:methyltransferase